MLPPYGSHKGFLGVLPSELGDHFKDDIHTSGHGRSIIGAILSVHDAREKFLIIGTDQVISPHPTADLLVDSLFFANILHEDIILNTNNTI